MNLQRVAVSSITIAASIAVAAGVVWAASDDVTELWGIPVIAVCAALAFVMQWLAFVPAYVRQTEQFYDLTGSLTYVTVTAFAMAVSRSGNLRSLVLGLLVFVWASRLGIFLFRRIRAKGGDSRFQGIKRSAARFVVAWTLQGLWVFLTLSAALTAITTRTAPSFGARDAVGVIIWLLGFSVEVIADRQKSRFRAKNPGRFVHEGLWAWSRHPNYFGEIVLWIGIFVIASSTLQRWQWVTVISPLFVIVLLTRLSGIPILEKQAEERWGDLESYRRYKQSTPALVPRPPRR
ncbi:MAG: DUF1295 domain-containing protein [Myxococcales bacterium]|jgi:steroid 5-alpha reductase family enzyme